MLLHDVDDDVDLDEPPPGSGERPPSGPRRGLPRALRSRWALPLVVAVLVGLVGTGAVRRAEASATDDLERARMLADVQLGGAQLGWDDVRDGRRDAEGRLLVPVRVAAFNGGSEAVSVRAVATSMGDLGAPAVALLEPGSGESLRLDLAVDCTAVPRVGAQGGPAGDGEVPWVELEVSGDGHLADHRYLTRDAPGSSVADALPYACDPVFTGAVSVSVSVSEDAGTDGQLLVDLDNASQDPLRVRLTAMAAVGLSVDGDAAGTGSTTVVEPGGSARLRLEAAPDCAALGGSWASPAGAPAHAAAVASSATSVALQRAVDGQRWDKNLLDEVVTAAWVARRVTLACG